MAQAPTLYDFDLALSHVDRSLDARLNFRVARHPSETLDRVWLRVLAACLFHEERLVFGKGLSDPDQPDLEERDLTGVLTRWIRVGKAEPRAVQKAVDQNGRARVAVLFESPQRMEAFLADARAEKLTRLARAELAAVEPGLIAALASREERRAKASVTIVGDHFYVERDGKSVDGALARGAL
jgi:uncharacterized protein YaeQ